MREIDEVLPTLDKFKARIAEELDVVSRKAKKVDASIKTFLGVVLRKAALEDCDEGHSNTFEDLALEEIKEWDKTLQHKETELKTFIKNYLYALLSYGTLDARDIEELENEVDKISDYFTEVSDNDFSTYGAHGIKDLIERIKFFGKQIKEFRCWDSIYNINLFADSLVMTGKYIRDRGNTVSHVKQGRKCMAAGGMLKKAYSHEMDNALSNYYDVSHWSAEKLDDGSGLYSWNMEYKTSHPKRLEKMMKIASKRNNINEIQRQVDAWNYVTKQVGNYVVPYPRINQWWD